MRSPTAFGAKPRCGSRVMFERHSDRWVHPPAGAGRLHTCQEGSWDPAGLGSSARDAVRTDRTSRRSAPGSVRFPRRRFFEFPSWSRRPPFGRRSTSPAEYRPEVGAMEIHEDEIRPLSGAQEGIWFAHRLGPGKGAYNTGEYVEIHGRVDPEVFEAALRRTVAEAETFALRFLDTPDGPRCVLPAQPAHWPLHR